MTATQLSPEAKTDAVREYERQTTGTDQWHKHPLGLIYTDGMRYLAETCGAFWLLDLVASHQPAILRAHPDRHDFQVWRIMQHGEGWRAEAWDDTPGDGESNLLAFQDIEYSDFPRPLAPFEFFVEGGVALLKGER